MVSETESTTTDKNKKEDDKNKKEEVKSKTDDKKNTEPEKKTDDKKNTETDNNNTKKDTSNTTSTKSNKKYDDKKENGGGGSVDEKGNPLPVENPEGGDPVCPGGYKIDYDFDPFNDPINPPFRCISALKDPTDGIAGKALEMANNPSAGVENVATGSIPKRMGGRHKSRHKHSSESRKNHSRKTRRSRHHYRSSRRRQGRRHRSHKTR